MSHRRTYEPFPARTPGGSDHPVAVTEAFPPLPAAVDLVVGVIDTGIAVDAARRPHPWFADHVAFREQDIDRLGVGAGDDDEHGFLARADGHGTFVTGLVLRQAPRARVTMWGVIDTVDDEIGAGIAVPLGAGDDVAVAEAVRALAADGDVQVVNLSFGGGVFADEKAADGLKAALASLGEGVAVVAAAGNAGTTDPVWPAAFPGVISVGAFDERRWRPAGATPPYAAFSNTGEWVRAYADGVQVLGPFVEVDETGGRDGIGEADRTGGVDEADRIGGVDEPPLGARPPQHFRGWARWSGTSFAAATVSGRIAQTAIELQVCGAEAARIVLRESRTVNAAGAVWVRGNR